MCCSDSQKPVVTRQIPGPTHRDSVVQEMQSGQGCPVNDSPYLRANALEPGICLHRRVCRTRAAHRENHEGFAIKMTWVSVSDPAYQELQDSEKKSLNPWQPQFAHLLHRDKNIYSQGLF